MIDYFYDMTLKVLLKSKFDVHGSTFYHIYAVLLWTSLHNISKYVSD